MSQTVQVVDFKQLLAQQGDASSLSEAELGRLKKQYEKLRKEWARKRRKLEKLDRAARAKQHVRKKLQEQKSQTGGATDSTSPILQQHSGENGEEPTPEGKVVHHQQEDHTAVDFTCGKSVSFSLDIAPGDENTQHEHPAKFEICTLSSVPTSGENALKSTNKLKVCNVSKAGDVTKQGTRQSSRKSNSLATFPGCMENSTQSTHSTSEKCDSNDTTVQEEEVSIVQKSSATLGLGNASACIREELGENEYDRNVGEQGENTMLHFCDAIQDTRKRKPLFKGSFRQTIPNENLDESARHCEQKISFQTQGKDLNSSREKSPRNSNCTYSSLDVSVEYVDDNLSGYRAPESSYCEGQMPGQQSQLPLTNTTIVLDSEEDETECTDDLHLTHDIPPKSQTKQKENTGIIGAEKKTKPSSLDTQSQRNITELSPGQETPLEEGNYCNKKVAKNSVELTSGQEGFHEEDNSQIVEPSQGNFDKNTWVDGLMFPAEYYVRTTRRMQRQGLTPEGVARQVKGRTQRKQKRKVDSNNDGALENTGGKKQAKLEVPGSSAAKQAKLDVAGTTDVKQAKLDLAGSCAVKQAKLDVTGTSAAILPGVEVDKSSALFLDDAKDYKALAKEGGKGTMQKLSPVANASISENMSGPRRRLKTSTEGITNKMENKDVVSPGVQRLESGVEDFSAGVQVCTASGVQVCSSPGEKSTDGEFHDTVIPDTQYSLSKSCFPLNDLQKDLSNLPKNLICEGVVQETQYNPSKSCCPLQDIRKGLKDLPKDLISEGVVQDKLQVLRKGRKAWSTHNTPVQSSGLRRLVKGRKTTRSCQNSPVQSGCSSVLKEVEESLKDCSQVVETRSCQNSPVQTGCSSVVKGVEESLQDCSQDVEVQRSVKGRKTTKSCQNSPVQSVCLNVLKGGEESLQDCSQVVEGVVLCRRSKRLKNRCSQEVQNSTIQEQNALKGVQALTAQPESGFLTENQDTKNGTQRFFPVLSDQLRVKLRHSEATEFHLPYSDYGTLKVAKAREAPSVDVSKKCSSRSSSEMDAKDVGMPCKDSSFKYKKENQAILLGEDSLLPSRINKNLDVTSAGGSKTCSSRSSSEIDASLPSKEASVKYKKEDHPLPVPAESLSPLRSNRNLDVISRQSSCKGNSPNLVSKIELCQEKSRNLFPSLSPMLHKKCTEAVLDFSLVGTDYVKLKLNKVKSSPQPAAATSSCCLNSRHGKGRQSMGKAKGNLQASSSNSKIPVKEKSSSVKQPSEVTVVENRKQQKVDDVIQEKSSKVCKEENLLPNNNKNEFSRTTSPDASVQPSSGPQVRVSNSGIQAPSIDEEEGTFPMSCPSAEDQNAFTGIDRNKVGTMCENGKLPVTASTKPLGPQNLIASKSPCSKLKAIEMTLENNEVRICEVQASQDVAALVDKGSTDRGVPCSDYTEPISQKMEDTDKKRVKIMSECFNGRTSESDSFLSATPLEGRHETEKEAGQTGVEETEESVATRVTDVSTCLKPTSCTRESAVVSVALGEARIHEEDAAVLVVCQQTTVSLWVQQGEDWALGASWKIPEHEEVCEVFLLPCEDGVQVMVGGNFTTGFLKFFHFDGVSTSSQDPSWDEGVALVGDGFHGDGCHGDSYHAMAVLPQAVAIATGPCDGGSSVRKLTVSSPAGHVEQQTRLPVPAAQWIGSMQQVEGCAGCLMGIGDNQVLLWNHTAGVLLRCVDLPGAHPTCLYAASAQGLLFTVVCSPDEHRQDGCHLVAINPRTGPSLSLQNYQLPHGSSLARCAQGGNDGPRLLIIHGNGSLYLWDFFSGEMDLLLPGVSKKPSCVTTGK